MYEVQLEISFSDLVRTECKKLTDRIRENSSDLDVIISDIISWHRDNTWPHDPPRWVIGDLIFKLDSVYENTELIANLWCEHKSEAMN